MITLLVGGTRDGERIEYDSTYMERIRLPICRGGNFLDPVRTIDEEFYVPLELVGHDGKQFERFVVLRSPELSGADVIRSLISSYPNKTETTVWRSEPGRFFAEKVATFRKQAPRLPVEPKSETVSVPHTETESGRTS